METQVLKQEDSARSRVSASCFDFITDAIIQESNRLSKKFLEFLCNWLEGKLRGDDAIRAACYCRLLKLHGAYMSLSVAIMHTQIPKCDISTILLAPPSSACLIVGIAATTR